MYLIIVSHTPYVNMGRNHEYVIVLNLLTHHQIEKGQGKRPVPVEQEIWGDLLECGELLKHRGNGICGPLDWLCGSISFCTVPKVLVLIAIGIPPIVLFSLKVLFLPRSLHLLSFLPFVKPSYFLCKTAHNGVRCQNCLSGLPALDPSHLFFPSCGA